MTRFYLNAGALGRWMHQNKALYTGAYVEGVLIDSFVVETKRGVAAIYEHALSGQAIIMLSSLITRTALRMARLIRFGLTDTLLKKRLVRKR